MPKAQSPSRILVAAPSRAAKILAGARGVEDADEAARAVNVNAFTTLDGCKSVHEFSDSSLLILFWKENRMVAA